MLPAFGPSPAKLGMDYLDLYLIHWPALAIDRYPARSPKAPCWPVRQLAIADSHGVTRAQPILRWHLQQGRVVIPKSVTPAADPQESGRLRLRRDS